LCALFRAGEEAVTRDFLPFFKVVANEGRLEEELYLTSFLWEEAKHVDFFNRYVEEVAQELGATPPFLASAYQQLIREELPRSMEQLYTDSGPVAQVRASVTYHLVVEGVLAETGYLLFRRLLPPPQLAGLRTAIGHIVRDESRHVAYGIYSICRNIIVHGDIAYKAFLTRMTELKPLVEQSCHELVECWREGQDGPTAEELARHSEEKFARRVSCILAARGQDPGWLGLADRFEAENK
jgi:ribonucleoside-diphosphate reductase beta chain